MGTEVLRPQDCLIHHHHHHQRIGATPVVFPRRKTNYYGNGNGQSKPNINGNRKVQIRPEQQRRRSPEPAPAPATAPKRSASVGDLKAARSNQIVMGQVTILRRGETINDWKEIPTPLKSFPGATDVYAGSAFSLSPSPRAVPLPSFFSRKSCPNATVDDSATKDLRRLLRLE